MLGRGRTHYHKCIMNPQQGEDGDEGRTGLSRTRENGPVEGRREEPPTNPGIPAIAREQEIPVWLCYFNHYILYFVKPN